MTAQAATYRRSPSLFPLIFLALLVTAAGAILLSAHAEKHREADAIRRCLAENGPLMELEGRSDPSVRCFVVELQTQPCSKWAILIAQLWPSATDRCELRERTAFQPRDGSPDAVTDYVSRDFKLP